MKTYLKIEKLDDHSWVISEGKGNGRTHCYLLEGENIAILIDTGLGLVNMKKITQSLTNKDIKVINTHGHLDHISKNYQFEKTFMHSRDLKLFKQHSDPHFRYQHYKSRYLKKGYSKWFVNSILFKIYIRSLWNIPHANLPNLLCNQIELGNRKLKIIETPGHTQGSVCILDESRKWLFTGDTICEKGILLQLDESTNIEEYLKSMIKLKEIAPSIRHIYAGHQKIPLDTSYIDDYIYCSKEIIKNYENQRNPTTYRYKNINITFKKVFKE